jgi:uncharacterized membrane protein
MKPEYQLVVAWILFGGTHILGSWVPLRKKLIGALGLQGFKGLYSVVALATFVPLVWIAWHNRHEGAIVYDPPSWTRHLTELLMLPAIFLIVMTYATPSPATTLSEISGKSPSSARGIHRITRHPMNMGCLLFGVAHMISNPTVGDWIFWGGFVVFGIAAAVHQDRRLLATGTDAFRSFHAETSLVPFTAVFSGKQKVSIREFRWWAVLIALALYAALRLGHPHMIGGFGS